MKHTPAKGSQEEMWEVMCVNPDCPALMVRSLCHFLSEVGALGLGESKVEQLFYGGKKGPAVERPADFYCLSVARAMTCGFSRRQALLAMATIHMVSNATDYEDNELKDAVATAAAVKKKIPFWKMFSGFGIPTAGKSAGKELIAHFQSFDAIRDASVDELAEVEGVGGKTAEIVHAYLKKHRRDIDALLKYIDPQLPTVGAMTGKKFVLSGSFDQGKKHWEALIEAQGGKVSSAVSKTTTFLVAGPGSGSKSKKADDLGVKKIDEGQLEKMLK